MRKGFRLLFLVITAVGANASSQSTSELFQNANKMYEARVYDSAAAGYKTILATGVESSPIYFNLGNAYFKSGDLGRAVANYLRAQRLDPSDQDIAANLEFAKGLTSVQVEGAQLNPVGSSVNKLLALYKLNTLAWWSSCAFVLFIGILIARYVFRFDPVWMNSVLYLSIAAVVLLGSATSWKYRVEYLQPRAVVVAEDSPVLTGPTPQSDLELNAVPGMIVEILDQSGDYYSVRFENMRRGWIRKGLVEVV